MEIRKHDVILEKKMEIRKQMDKKDGRIET